nr:MAG TPA: hypothetical protein [Caudoviricetes sp.]
MIALLFQLTESMVLLSAISLRIEFTLFSNLLLLSKKLLRI